MDEKVLVLCEKWLSKFSSNLYVLRPPESENMVFTKVSVCLSVVGRVRHNSRQNYQIELSFGTLYWSRESKDKFVNQPHPIKIEGLSTTFVFLKIIFWKNQKLQYCFLIVLINLYKLSCSHFLIKSKLEMLQHIQIRKKSISKFHFPVKLYEIIKNIMIQYYFLHKDLHIWIVRFFHKMHIFFSFLIKKKLLKIQNSTF